MAFTTIRKEEFDRFQPPNLIMQTLVMEQVEWFANPPGTVLGTLAGTQEKGWRYAVLQRDARGHFRIHKLGGSSGTFDTARSQFLQEMEAAEKITATPAKLTARAAS